VDKKGEGEIRGQQVGGSRYSGPNELFFVRIRSLSGVPG
jgi:hypothetical protein